VVDLELTAPPGGRPLTVVAIGAHSDDIEIGCGATILRLAESGLPLRVVWVVLSAGGARADEAGESARAFLAGVDSDIRLASFRDAFFPHDESVKEFFEGLKRDVAPDIVLTHTRHDLHQDHRVVCELTWNTFRDHLTLEYEVPKYDGDLGSPNVFVPVEERVARRKCELLVEHFATQRDKHWFTEDVFLGLMRLRGVESRSPTGYAEGFHGRKVRVGIGGGRSGASPLEGR
jgi:LmbE family N-acetylglucosaminyl deacetylase